MPYTRVFEGRCASPPPRRWFLARLGLCAVLAALGSGCLAQPDRRNANGPAPLQEKHPMNGMDMPKPKRVGPPEVEAVTLGGVRYDALHWGRERGLDQNGGYVVATDVASGHELWMARVYRVEYVPKLETDVQDIFIKSLEPAADGQELVVTDERGRKFVLDLTTHDARPIP